MIIFYERERDSFVCVVRYRLRYYRGAMDLQVQLVNAISDFKKCVVCTNIQGESVWGSKKEAIHTENSGGERRFYTHTFHVALWILWFAV